jgi:hypothetical protein
MEFIDKNFAKYKEIVKNDLIFGLFVVIFIVLNIFSSKLTQSMEYPLLAMGMNIIYALSYFSILYFIGFFVMNIVRFLNKTKNNDDDFEIIDYILTGIIFIVCIGIVAGILGMLTFWYYGIVIFILYITSRYFNLSIQPKIRFNRYWIFILCLILFFSLLFKYELIAALVVNRFNPDYLILYLHQLKAILHSHSMIPNPFAFDWKVHEAYYTFLISMPTILPSFQYAIPFINIGMIIVDTVLIYSVISRIYNNRLLALLSAFLYILLDSAIFILHPVMTPIKSLFIFMTSLYLISIMYTMLFIIKKDKRFFWLAVISTGLLSGTAQVIGMFLSSATIVVIVLLYVRKKILKKDIVIAIVIIMSLCSVPKVINYYYSGYMFKGVIGYLLGNGLEKGYNEYNTILDEYLSQNDPKLYMNSGYIKFLYFNHPSPSLPDSDDSLKFYYIPNFIKTILFNRGGLIVIISMILTFIFYRKKSMGQAVIVYNLHMLPFLFYTTLKHERFNYYTFPWLVFVFAQILFVSTIIINNRDFFKALKEPLQKRVISVSLILLFCSYYITDQRVAILCLSGPEMIVKYISVYTHRKEVYLQNKEVFNNVTHVARPVDNISSQRKDTKVIPDDSSKKEAIDKNISSHLFNKIQRYFEVTPVKEAHDFIISERFKQIKSYFNPHELVFEFGDNGFSTSWATIIYEFYNYIPISFNNILYTALYYDNPKDVISTLKRLKIRYIILYLNESYIYSLRLQPKPTLFEKKYGGRYLRIVDRNVVQFSSKNVSEFSKPENIADSGVLLEILYQESPKDNDEVLKLIDKIKFEETFKLREMLLKNVLSDDVIERMKSFYK